MFDNLKGYKTVAFFVLTLLLSLANLAGFGNWEPTADQTSLIFAITSIIGIVLRYVTTTPIFRRE